jgi:superfamily II DNA or RNA helicase
MSTQHLSIKVYSHGYCAFNLSARGKWLCSQFARHFVQYGFVQQRGQYQRVGLRVFAAATEDRGEFRFHINTLHKFKQFLIENQIDRGLVSWESVALPEGADAEFVVKPQWVPRDYQLPVLSYLEKPLPLSKFVDLQTGKGKSFVALQALAGYGKRFAIIIKPMYIEKWVDDVIKTYDIEPKDIVVIRGSSQLMALLMLAKEGLVTQKVIILSNKTHQNWIKLYEKYRNDTLDMGYACVPEQFFEVLGVGVRLVDEVHQDFHFNLKLDLYSNVARSISLSATLINSDPFLVKMYEMVFPRSERYEGMALHRYIDAYAVHYRLAKPESIRTEEHGGRGYSHGALEKSIMRHPPTKNNYFRLIEKLIETSFLRIERPKKKLLVFAASIAMCTLLTEYFEHRFGELRVRRYVEDDDYQNLFDSDIVFTTLLSAGTAVDIPDLTTVILTTAIASEQSNVQGLGRLRELPDHPTSFYYLVCTDIPKHMEYHSKKVTMLKERAKSYHDIFTGAVV